MDDLGKILLNNHDKLNILYNKYFYGFEKEGKSAFFQEKSVYGLYLPYRYPFKEDLLASTIMMALNTPVNGARQFLLADLAAEKKRDQENKENLRRKQMESMTKDEQRKADRELKKQRKIEADLEPERVLREEMALVKRRVHAADLYMERIRGFVVVEGREEEQDF